MTFNNIRIVLVATSHPGNIGSVARAMKTMGLHRLYLVSPHLFPDWRADELAAGADDILKAATVTHSLQSALAGCHLALATSARPRDIALPGLTPSEGALLVRDSSDETEIAIVFGREHAGLTNEELLCCHYHLHIPSSPEFSSLNLAQAVQIVAYEIRMKRLSPVANVKMQTKDQLATVEDVEQFYEHLKRVLIDIDFLKPSNPKKLMQRLRCLFNRAHLLQLEVNILRGMLSNIDAVLKKQANRDE